MTFFYKNQVVFVTFIYVSLRLVTLLNFLVRYTITYSLFQLIVFYDFIIILNDKCWLMQIIFLSLSL